MKKIRELRMFYGLSQAELGRTAKVAQSHIRYIERGKKSPTLKTLGKIAKALDVPIETILEVEEKEDASPKSR